LGGTVAVPAIEPQIIDDFLAGAGWSDAQLDPIVGDASFRQYWRVAGKLGKAILMVAPPPEEDVKPFLEVAQYLLKNGMRAPEIFAADADKGFILLEDFGDKRMRETVDTLPLSDQQPVYRKAIDAIVKLHGQPIIDLPAYDMAVYEREALLFCDWYCPAAGLTVDKAGFVDAVHHIMKPVLEGQDRPVVVLRDYHAENIMLLEKNRQGLLDFQDALLGHPAYDIVSLLQDARRDVPHELEIAMCDYFCEHSQYHKDFKRDYAILGAQRNLKIVGIFMRLAVRDNKPRYPSLIPRVWRYLEQDLKHPSLEPMAAWFARNMPAELRARDGAIEGQSA
jgi:aminoglycoside/choline kinase family phosphotransferase